MEAIYYCHAGIMMPNISNKEVAMKLAVTGKCTCNLTNLPDIPITMMDNKCVLILTANPIYYFVQIFYLSVHNYFTAKFWLPIYIFNIADSRYQYVHCLMAYLLCNSSTCLHLWYSHSMYVCHGTLDPLQGCSKTI